MINVALVVETRRIPRGEIKEVAAAVQRQISRDFAPLWSVEATVDPFLAVEDVPPGYWPIIVRDEFPGMDIIGIHLDKHGQPFALVRANPTWSLVVSHEALEMISDPWGNRLMPGGSPRPGQGIVELLVEVCDPCGGVAHAYTLNGILVSDFLTPNFYDPVAVAGVRYSYTGVITRPREIAPGGYLAWREPTSRDWWSWDWINRSQPTFTRLGPLDDPAKPLRQQVDELSINSELYFGAPPDHPVVLAARERHASSRAASQAQAEDLDVRIGELIADSTRRYTPGGPSVDGDGRDEDDTGPVVEGGGVGGGPVVASIPPLGAPPAADAG